MTQSQIPAGALKVALFNETVSCGGGTMHQPFAMASDNTIWRYQFSQSVGTCTPAPANGCYAGCWQQVPGLASDITANDLVLGYPGSRVPLSAVERVEPELGLLHRLTSRWLHPARDSCFPRVFHRFPQRLLDRIRHSRADLPILLPTLWPMRGTGVHWADVLRLHPGHHVASNLSDGIGVRLRQRILQSVPAAMRRPPVEIVARGYRSL